MSRKKRVAPSDEEQEAQIPPIPPAPPYELMALAREGMEELGEWVDKVDLTRACNPVLLRVGDEIPRRAWYVTPGRYRVVVVESAIGRREIVVEVDEETMRIMRARFEMVRDRYARQGPSSVPSSLRLLIERRYFAGILNEYTQDHYGAYYHPV